MPDEEIVRWLDIALPHTRDDAIRFVTGAQGWWERRESAHFVIDHDGRFAGYLGVLAVEEAMRAVEIVYWIARASRNQGVATQALGQVLPWLVEEIRPERIELGMVLGNAASERVARANGFVRHEVRLGEARLDGVPADELIMEWTGA